MIERYIRTYGKRLYGLCVTLCADRFEADDLYQETWLRAYRSLPQYDPQKPFESWLTKICVNTYRNVLRRIKRSPVLQFRTNEEKDLVYAQVPAPEAEDYSDLYDAIDKLPEKLRITIILFYFRDMDVSSAAEALGIPEGTVKSRLNKARKLLKEVLENEADL